jgi:regulator of RNase E activity RraA
VGSLSSQAIEDGRGHHPNNKSAGDDMETGTINRPTKAIIKAFRNIGTSTIGNALDDLGIAGVMPNLKPVWPGARYVGPAFTAKEVTGVHGSYTGADFKLGAIIDQAKPGDVVVIDNAGHQVSTWGGIASFAARQKGIAGLLVDGGVRDADEIEEFAFSAFARHVTPTSAKGRIKVLAINVPVKMDGILVRPGDVICADATGVVCVPHEVAEKVARTARLFDKQDKQAIEEIRRGLTFTAALAKFKKL